MKEIETQDFLIYLCKTVTEIKEQNKILEEKINILRGHVIDLKRGNEPLHILK